ncbi:phage major capsid protein [Azospirillum thermophilum]|uniref:Phage major capsid protein n=1 Tax=Azospirillum thermophilum TaxID=2202148 RepID=A0A2S2D0Z2_9PROT|nr:phage major capsid protein [Azospirillum thermophilum]AWK90355.1 phage major capsid protein [Azospirillum thermophilum]
MNITLLRQQYAKAVDELGTLTADAAAFEKKEAEVVALKAQIERALKAQQLAADTAEPTVGQPNTPVMPTAPAQPATKVAKLGGLVKALYHAGGNHMLAQQWAEKHMGESHPVTKSLNTAVAASGGATLAEDVANEVIELLRPRTVVRASGPRVIPMPRGTMRMPKQTSGVTGTYGGEGAKAGTQQLGTGNIVASFKKLTVLTPVSNDWLRYTSSATDAMVQDDVVLGLAGTEDLAFLRGDGTGEWPKGMRTIALPQNRIPSKAAFDLESIDQELSAAILALELGDIPMLQPVWFFNPRIKEFLLNLKNSNGFYVYKEEMTARGTLRGYPFKTTTRIPQNLGAGGDETEILFGDMSQAMIFDALTLSLAMSTESTYTDEGGTQRNAFERDETLFRGIAEHDFHMRHDGAVAVIVSVKWR